MIQLLTHSNKPPIEVTAPGINVSGLVIFATITVVVNTNVRIVHGIGMYFSV